MQNNERFVKITAGITALILTLTLITGCNYRKKDKFYFHPNLRGEMILDRNSYISIDYVENYYVIRLYNTILNRNSIFIAYRFKYTNGDSQYINVFNNNKIAYENSEIDYYDFINVKPLIDVLEEYNQVKDKYTYEDLQKILETIKTTYHFEEENKKIKKRIKE